jgi:hypothetical protein
MLITTRTNLNLLQDAFLNDFKTRQIMAAVATRRISPGRKHVEVGAEPGGKSRLQGWLVFPCNIGRTCANSAV